MSSKPSQCTHSCTATTSLEHSQYPDKGDSQSFSILWKGVKHVFKVQSWPKLIRKRKVELW